MAPTEKNPEGPAKKKKPPQGFFGIVQRYLPFLSAERKEPQRLRNDSPVLIERRKEHVKEIIQRRKQLLKAPHVRQNTGRLLPALPKETKTEQPALPASATDDLSVKLFSPAKEEPATALQPEHGIWDSGDGKSVLPQPSSPSPQRRSGGGLFSFFGRLFSRPAKPAAEIREPEETSPVPVSVQPPVTGEKPDADLDALIGKPDDAKAGKILSKEEPTPVQPALPRADLIELSDRQEKRIAEKERAADTALAAAKEHVVLEEKKRKEAEKAAPKKEDASDKNAAAQDIIFKPRPVHHSSAFGEFLGAVKYLGLGKERQSVIQNLATMLNAGLPLIDSLKTLQMETRIRPMKKLLQRIVDLVENGSPLWRAMEDQHFFSPHAIALIRIGEEAGNLAKNMEYLAEQQEKDAGLRAKIKMAMIYPTIVFVMMFVIVIGLGMFVLPSLISVLYSLNVELPLSTRIIIIFTEFFTSYGKVAVPSMVAGLLLLLILGKFTPLRVVAQWFLFRIPGIGRLTREATIARFGVILGGLLQAGVPFVDALRSMAEVTPVVAYRKFYFKLLDHVTLGDSFAKSFQVLRGSQTLLPASVQQLVITGEKSGSLSAILLKIADIYEKKANNTAEKLPVILEPMLLLFIGGLVGTIAFSIIVPIYSIVGNVGH